MAMVNMTRLEPLEDMTDHLNNPEVLRSRAADDGILFFAGLLSPSKVNGVRSQILPVCDRNGWVKEGSELLDGVAKSDVAVLDDADPRWRTFYDDTLKIRDFHELALDANLIHVFEVLFGEPVLPHSRNICRVVFPGTASHSTPPHQDHFYIGGSDDMWTAWIPCGDCPASLGGLAVAKGSHRQGKLDVKEAVGAGSHQVDVKEDQVWVGGDYACGDVILLHNLTIHQGQDNLSQDRLRLSCDFRYQPRSHPVRADSLVPHMDWLTWEEIYQDWEPTDPLKHYWKDWDLQIVEW